MGGRRRVAFVVPLAAPALLRRALGTDKVKIRDFHALDAEACAREGGGLSRLVMRSTPMLWMPGPGPDLHIATITFTVTRGEGGGGGGGGGGGAQAQGGGGGSGAGPAEPPFVTLGATVTATADALKWLIGGLRGAVEGMLLHQCEGMASSFMAFTAARAAGLAAGRGAPPRLPPLPPIALPPPLRPLAGRDISLPATPAAALALQAQVGAGGSGGCPAGAAALARLLGETEGGEGEGGCAPAPATPTTFSIVAATPGVAALASASSAGDLSDSDYHDAVEEEWRPAPLAGKRREGRGGGENSTRSLCPPSPCPVPRPGTRPSCPPPHSPPQKQNPCPPSLRSLPPLRAILSLLAPGRPLLSFLSLAPSSFFVLFFPSPRFRRLCRPAHLHGRRHAASLAPPADERARGGGGHTGSACRWRGCRDNSPGGGGARSRSGRLRRAHARAPPGQAGRADLPGGRHPSAQGGWWQRSGGRHGRRGGRHALVLPPRQVCRRRPGRRRRRRRRWRTGQHAWWWGHDWRQPAGGGRRWRGWGRAPAGRAAGEFRERFFFLSFIVFFSFPFLFLLCFLRLRDAVIARSRGALTQCVAHPTPTPPILSTISTKQSRSFRRAGDPPAPKPSRLARVTTTAVAAAPVAATHPQQTL